MSAQLKSELQSLVDTLLYDKDQAKRNEALKTVSTLSDKDKVEKILLKRFATEKNRWERTWAISVLAAIGLPDGMKKVLEHTAVPPEADGWVRHFALLNAANFAAFPLPEIECAVQDKDVLPKATALRLLLAHGEDQYEAELLVMLQDVHAPDGRWAAARALRNRTDIKMEPLRAHIEEHFIPCLAELASDPNIYLDTRWEAIQALASFRQQASAAAELAGLLVEENDSAIRRYYLEALASLDQPDQSQDALLKSVEDADAQIREDAATALKKMIGAEKSIKLLLPVVMGREKNTDMLVDALRHVDPDFAAKELREALGNPDMKVSTRANQLLTMLGGQTAAQILVGERAKALDKYTDILSDADNDVREHFKELMSQAKFSFWLSLVMHTIVFGIGVAGLIASLSLALRDGAATVSTWLGVGGAGASALAILLTSFYQNPLRNVRESLNSLMQVDVVFLGYVRQVNQIDATFKHMFLGARDFGTTQMQSTVAEIQSAVKEALGEIEKHIQNK
ncbi:MAG: hypothetical protein WCC12_12800 [Anaerolineales bacterium]